MEKSQSGRDDYWQAVRGLCILLVVLIHSTNGLQYSGQPGLDWNYYFWMIERQVINIPVAIFLFLSGYYIPVSRILKNPRDYLRDRIVRLVPSYIIWTVFYTVLDVVHLKKKPSACRYEALIGVLLFRKSGSSSLFHRCADTTDSFDSLVAAMCSVRTYSQIDVRGNSNLFDFYILLSNTL